MSTSTEAEPEPEPAPTFVRLQVELVVQIADRRALVSAALDQVAGDDALPDEERGHAVSAIEEDETEALAFLVDPYDLVSGVPGVELAQASWSCGHVPYDPDDPEARDGSEDWEFGEDDQEDEDDQDD